jgi:hypothetical protein
VSEHALLLTYLLTHMAWVQPKHPAVKRLGANMAHGGIHTQILPMQNKAQSQNCHAMIQTHPETTPERPPPAPGDPLVQGPPSLQGSFPNEAEHTLSTALRCRLIGCTGLQRCPDMMKRYLSAR